ncbi:metallocarboxypeptidase-like protein [Elsinoe australis]|uniref:Inactive metallocarboxypeptidase ECM14 n=1 Tax=Elsinoe australis TaxID=40998 RepID=A0A4U7B4J4_9PEZI|nr:metallocarboxypeptidase-like protein [Elsinoe australis]
MRPATFQTLVAALTILPSAQAVPNHHNIFQQQPLVAQSSQIRSPWRVFSDKIIEKVWGIEEQIKSTTGRKGVHWEEPPLATKSQHGLDLVLRFNISSTEEARKLAEVANYMYLDIWDHTSEWVDIRMAKDTLPHVLKQLPESMQHAHTALLQEKELQQAIFDSYPSARKAAPLSPSDPHPHGHFTPSLRPLSPPSSAADNNIFFADYQPLSVITPWMRLLSSLFTTHVRLVNIGLTYEGRDIPALHVGVHPTNDDEPSPPRKTVLITGGIHAREWISVSTVTYIAYTMITEYGKNPEITQLLEDFDWLFIPTLNPDGYTYTWESDRLWRKNRQKTPLRFCFGLDLDRSFPFQWDSSTVGNPCSESYAGEAPLQGVEARALRDFIRNETANNNVEFVGLLDLHSYSQQILYPYSYSCEAYPPSLENLEELAIGLSKAIRIQSGHSYQSKQACEGNVAFGVTDGKGKDVGVRFESAGGSALDWFYHEVGIRYAYQVKLRDRGAYGFLLPKEHIVPTGREMLEAALYFGRYVDGEFEGLAKGKEARRGKVRSQSGW